MSEVRHVRAEGAPLVFRVPPGWPEPLEIWVLMNQAWELPHATWVPRDGVPQAPLTWRFWDAEPMFEQLVGELNVPHNRRIAWGLGLLVVGMALSAGSALFLLLSIWGVWMFLSGVVRRYNSRDQAMLAVRVNAFGVRHEMMAELYNDYLNDAGHS